MLRYLILILAAATMTFCTVAVASDYNLPDLGVTADKSMSLAAEQRIGRQIVTHLLQSGAIVEDPELTHYINRVGRRLARHTDRPASQFKFYVVNDNSINAFALPGGYIGVNSGLIQATDSASELAAVLAHEIAHVTQRHIARQMQETKGATLTTLAAMLLAMIASGGNPAVIQAAITMGLSGLGQQQINYTRAHEQEADRIGIHTLAASGYDPHAMGRFFKKLERQSRLYGNQLPQILLTHPLSKNRVAEARARADQLPVNNFHVFYAYPFMRARVRVLTSRRPSRTVHYFDKKRGSHKQHQHAADYGYALALIRIGHAQQAVKILRKLGSKDAGHPYVPLALAHALARDGKPEAALTELSKTESKFPTYRPLSLAYARALINNRQPRQARDYLLNKRQLQTHDAQAQKLLADAANALGNKGEAYFRGARYSYLRGQYGSAIKQLMTALHLPQLSTLEKSRIKAALAQFRNQCHQRHSKKECRHQVRDKQRPGVGSAGLVPALP